VQLEGSFNLLTREHHLSLPWATSIPSNLSFRILPIDADKYYSSIYELVFQWAFFFWVSSQYLCVNVFYNVWKPCAPPMNPITFGSHEPQPCILHRLEATCPKEVSYTVCKSRALNMYLIPFGSNVPQICILYCLEATCPKHLSYTVWKPRAPKFDPIPSGTHVPHKCIL